MDRKSDRNPSVTPSANKRALAIIEAAKESLEREGEIEIDLPSPINAMTDISEGDDNGCYVQAWVWFPFEGTPWDKEKEES
jgi:hypothetical protein